MFGSAWKPGNTGLFITRAETVQVRCTPSLPIIRYVTGALKSCGVPEAGLIVAPSASVNVGASAVTSVPSATGSFTVPAASSMIASTLSCGNVTLPMEAPRPARFRISAPLSAVL